MSSLTYWVSPILAGIVAFLGLLASSRAADEAFSVGGLIIFVACLGYIFSAIGRHFDRMDATH